MAQVKAIELTESEEALVSSDEGCMRELWRTIHSMDPMDREAIWKREEFPGETVYSQKPGQELLRCLQPRPEFRVTRDGTLQVSDVTILPMGLSEGRFYVRYTKGWTDTPVYRLVHPGPLSKSTVPRDVYRPIEEVTPSVLFYIRQHGCVVRAHDIHDDRGEVNPLDWFRAWQSNPATCFSIDNHSGVRTEDPRAYRFALGKYLVRAGWGAELIDRAHEQAWAAASRSLSTHRDLTLTVHSGRAVTSVYENEIGGQSCMTERPEWVAFYAANPEHIKCAVVESGAGSTARCMLWMCPTGHVVYDRIYSRDIHPGVVIDQLAKRYGAERVVPAWCTRTEMETKHKLVTDEMIHGMVIPALRWPSNNSLPYFDNARWRPGQTGDTLDIYPLCNVCNDWSYRVGFRDQTCYTGGPRINDPDSPRCSDCDEAYSDEELQSCSDGNYRCEDCLDQWVFVEGYDDLQPADECCLVNDEWYHTDDCVWIEQDSEYILTDSAEEYLEEVARMAGQRIGLSAAISRISNIS